MSRNTMNELFGANNVKWDGRWLRPHERSSNMNEKDIFEFHQWVRHLQRELDKDPTNKYLIRELEESEKQLDRLRCAFHEPLARRWRANGS